MAARDEPYGWCSLRLRFDQRELELLSSAEQLRGTSLAHTTRPDVLRTALNLAKAGHKVRAAAPGHSVTFDETELALLVEALRFAGREVPIAARAQDGEHASRQQAILSAFPELIQKGTWRSFGLVRELEALAARLRSALESES
jgi:hypothetical protein